MVLNCNGRLLNLDIPKVMGIINVNNDSFYPKSRIISLDNILLKAYDMVANGASIIDIGVMSSRPGATIISHEEEWQTLQPIISHLTALDVIISIDTIWSKTAQKSIDTGVGIINDISGGSHDEEMLKIVAQYPVPYIMMHMKGEPSSMNNLANYSNLFLDIISFFKKQIISARSFGMKDIIIDPGFGFAKNMDQNYQLLEHLKVFKILELPIMVGLSRKSMLYRFLELSPDDMLNATTVSHTIAVLNGANILRVHDVKEAIEVVKICTKIKNS